MLMENEHILGESSVRKVLILQERGFGYGQEMGMARSYFKEPNEKEFLWIYPKVKRQ